MIKYYGRLGFGLHGDKQDIGPHFFESVKPLRLYQDDHWYLPPGTFIFPDFKNLPWIADHIVNEEAEVFIVVPFWKKREWWKKLQTVVTKLPILIPRAKDSFLLSENPIRRSIWHTTILQFNSKLLPRFQRTPPEFLDLTDRLLETLTSELARMLIEVRSFRYSCGHRIFAGESK